MNLTIALTGMPPFADDPRRACKGKDPNLWFPQIGAGGHKEG